MALSKLSIAFATVLSFHGMGSCQGKDGDESRVHRPVSKTIHYRLGDNVIRIQAIQYGAVATPTYINLHDDEATSVMGAKQLLEKKGGLLIRLDNGGRRNVRFRLQGKYYMFDPNRIFSKKGIAASLKTYGRTSPAAIIAVEKFAQRLLEVIPDEPTYIVALHNNTDGRFSLSSFYPGESRARDAKQVFVGEGQDDDDIFLTTDSVLYHQLITENFNTIWQDNKNAHRDGSLSIYFGEKNIAYLNCETEHGRMEQYIRMIEAASKYLYPVNNGSPPPVAETQPTGPNLINRRPLFVSSRNDFIP